MNFVQKDKGYYQSDPQIQISPGDEKHYIVETLEGETESGEEDNRCKWV